MMCFRDTSFCTAKCMNMECPRQYTKETAKAADFWWNGPLDTQKERTSPPVSFMDFSPTCPVYQPAKEGWDYPATERTQPEKKDG